MNILIIEDNIFEARLIERLAAGWGHRVEISRTGEEALEKFRKGKFDLVLLDIFLPDRQGHHLIPHLKEVQSGVGIVTMTAYNSPELELEVRQQGIIYYMIKPFEEMALKEILDHISLKARGPP